MELETEEMRAQSKDINPGDRVVVIPFNSHENRYSFPGVRAGDSGVVSGISGAAKMVWRVELDNGKTFSAWSYEVGLEKDPEWIQKVRETQVQEVQNG